MKSLGSDRDVARTILRLCCGSQIADDESVYLTSDANGIAIDARGRLGRHRRLTETVWKSSHRNRQHMVLSVGQLAGLGTELRDSGRRIVFTNGCFDVLHLGHVTSLAEAARLGDSLVVGINSDASVRRLKGPQRPILDQAERARMLCSLAFVTAVVIFDEDTPCCLLEALRPDVLVKGGTYRPDEVVGEIVEAYGGTVHVTGIIDGLSTTRIVDTVQQTHHRALSFSSLLANINGL